MAKKTKDTGTSTTKKETAPPDPVKTRSLVRLLNILALLLAIAAFLLQLFAVLSHHWKWQSTNLHSLDPRAVQNVQHNIYGDSRLDQNYGLYSRQVKVFADNDQHHDIWASTRFPRPDENDDVLHQCLTRTSSLRGTFLTCSPGLNPPEQCHCRRYPYWKWVIFFEIGALVLLGLVVVLAALQPTYLGNSLRPVAAGLAFLAFIFLLIGLILILTHLKRETRSFADAYPHINRRVSDKLGVVYNQNQVQYPAYYPQRRSVQRRAAEFYRAYSLTPGQHPFNDTHFQEYSQEKRAWVYRPYASLAQPVPYAPLSQNREGVYTTASRRNATATPVYSRYGPALGYDQVYDATTAGIGWSTVLSILATILSLLLPLLLAFALLQSKKLGPDTKTKTTTTTTTNVKQEYTAIPLNPPSETVTTRSIHADYDPQRPIDDALVTTRNVPKNNDPVIVRDVIIRDDQPATVTKTDEQQTTNQKNAETSQTSTNYVNT